MRLFGLFRKAYKKTVAAVKSARNKSMNEFLYSRDSTDTEALNSHQSNTLPQFSCVLFVFLEITSYYVRVIITRKHLLFSRDNEIILWRSQDTKLGDSKQTSYCPVDYNLFVGRWKRNYQHLCVFESYA